MERFSICGRFWVKKDGKNYIGEGRIHLLREIAATGSISKAAQEMGMSYKAAWDDVDLMNSMSPSPLVVRTAGGKQGGGTMLTPAGYAILSYYDKLQDAFDEFVSKALSIDIIDDI